MKEWYRDFTTFREWIDDRTDMYLGTISIDASILKELINRIEVLEAKDQSGPTNEVSPKVAHSTSAICLICNFTLSAHADEYCPVTVGGVVTKFISNICHLTWSAASGLKIKEISHDELVMCKIKGPHDINTCLHLSNPRP